jgi:hypothetical protein
VIITSLNLHSFEPDLLRILNTKFH